MPTVMTTLEAKENFTDLVNHVAQSKERILLTRRGKEIAALIPLEDLQILELTRDKHDLEEAMDAFKEAKDTGTTSLEQLKDEVGSS
jgi:prevent-host-death family protein